MWLINSSIGRKVVMSVTGLALILFLTFHGCMNVVALFSKEGYNWICEMLGANWYAVAATMGLALLALLHIFFAPVAYKVREYVLFPTVNTHSNVIATFGSTTSG